MANPPTVTSFLTFIRNVMGVPAAYLPDTAPIIQHAFDEAVNIVNQDLGTTASQTTSWTVLELATYNLAGHYLIEYAPDLTFAISAATWASGIVTLTLPNPNSVLVGDKVAVGGISPNGYNGLFTVLAVISASQITYPLAPNPGAALSGGTLSEQYFRNARAGLKISSFAPGLIATASDLSTSMGLDNPDFIKGLTLADLQLAKTSFGRAYLGIAQKAGPSLWGMT